MLNFSHKKSSIAGAFFMALFLETGIFL